MRALYRRTVAVAAVLGLGLGSAATSHASFHFMQIEQVVAGFCGDPQLQAVQLRMRAAGQNLVGVSRLLFYDEQGQNPTVLFDFTSMVSGNEQGDRILVATGPFAARFGITPDGTISTPIPPELFDAGRLTFEGDVNTIFWSLSWGGAGYTGSTTGSITNDDDGDFGPPFPGPLPSSTGQGLLFDGSASDGSTTNAADYVLSAGDAEVTNNMGTSVVLGGCLFGDGFEGGDTSAWSSVSP